MTGSKRMDHWTGGTVYKCSEIASSAQGSPPAANYVGCKAGRRTTGTEELCEIKWDYHIVWPSDSSGQCLPQSRQGHQCSKTTLTGESRFTLVPPWGLNPGPS